MHRRKEWKVGGRFIGRGVLTWWKEGGKTDNDSKRATHTEVPRSGLLVLCESMDARDSRDLLAITPTRETGFGRRCHGRGVSTTRFTRKRPSSAGREGKIC